MIDFTEISLGEHGPGCSRCGRARSAVYRASEDLLAEIDGVASSSGHHNVAMVGPDALAFGPLGEVVSAAIRAGAERIRVDVDAEGLAAGADRLLDMGVRHVRFSLLPALGDSRRSATATDGARRFLDRAEQRESRVAVTATLPLCRHTVQEAPTAAMLSAEARADSLLLFVDDPGLDLRKVAPWIMAACDTGMVNVVWVEVEGLPFCFMEGYELHLANAVRSHSGCKHGKCASCAADPFCDGVVEGASATVLGAIQVRSDHEVLGERLRRARIGVSA